MRDIKFRGLNSNNHWIEGNLCICQNGDYVIGECANKGQTFWRAPVKPDTVGQYTGLIDKNNKEIYEGDVIKVIEVDNTKVTEFTAIVKWDDCAFVLNHIEDKNMGDWLALCSSTNILPLTESEVIGNIYENPDLLGGEA